MLRHFMSSVAAAIAATTFAGCGGDGPELGTVEGTVELDGRPLEGAAVTFTPRGGGRPSMAQTDSEGKYELAYTIHRQGALPGEHEVTISTFQKADADSGQAAVPEHVPEKYNRRTELVKTVAAEDNVIDFALKSD